MKAKQINEFRVGKLQNLSEDDNVGASFGLPYLSLKRLRDLWEAGFPILGLEKDSLFWVGSNYYCSPIDENTYKFWRSVVEQVADNPPKLVTAFTVESSVNEFLMKSVYSRSICCISAERKLDMPQAELVEYNAQNTDDLHNTLKDSGRLVIKLQGMFREQNEKGEMEDNPDEVSFLVVSNKNEDAEHFAKDMYDLGVKYKQNSILLRDKGNEKAYYMGTSEVKNPDTFAPGLGKKAEIGNLVPYKMLDYCSVPFKYAKDKDGYIRKIDTKDAFAFTIPEDDEKVKGEWKLIAPNIYSHGEGDKVEYKWIVTKNGIKYGGIVDNIGLAKQYVRLAKAGKISQQYRLKGNK